MGNTTSVYYLGWWKRKLSLIKKEKKKMTKSKKAAISVTLVLTLLLVCSIQCMTVYAQHYGAANFYTTNWYTVPDGEYPTYEDAIGTHEEQNVQWAFSQISDLMLQQTYDYPYLGIIQPEPVYPSKIENHGALTNPTLVMNQIAESRANNWWSTDLYVGHKAVRTPDNPLLPR